MTDFVTRLEAELNAAALRQERRGRVRGAALPRLRIAVGDAPMAALAAVLLGLAVVASAVLLSVSPRQGAAGELPPALSGVWRAAPTELRLYDAGAQRCLNLGLGDSAPCYTIGDAGSRVAQEWGKVTISDDTLTLRDWQGSAPGVYRWRLDGGRLRLSEVSDPDTARTRELVTMPMTPVQQADRHPRLPSGWVTHTFTSRRFGYSIGVPYHWTVDKRGRADRYSLNPIRNTLPEMRVAAEALPAATSAARWGVIVDSRSEANGCAPLAFRRFFVGGIKIRVSVYRGCGAGHIETASFVHGGRGYWAKWRGRTTHPEADYERFDTLLGTVRFPP